MKLRLWPCLSLVCLLSTAAIVISGEPVDYNLTDISKLEIYGKETEICDYKDQKALRIKPGPGDGIACIKDFQFEDGTIELDIAAIPSFTGLVFRLRDRDIYEAIYFRPQNSHHDDPVFQQRTVQYISHPGNTWHYLRNSYPGKYESHADLEPDSWFHVRVVVKGERLKVFVNEETEPCLEVEKLLHGKSMGTVGVWTGNTSGGTFANLKISPDPGVKREDFPVPVSYSAEQEFLFETFKTRRSVRKFQSTPVPDEHILKILDIARTAPTSGNQQPWKFFVTRDRDKLNQLRDKIVDAAVERIQKRDKPDEKDLHKIRENYFQLPPD